jgi:GNAT superfamily N-acetyltransferase
VRRVDADSAASEAILIACIKLASAGFGHDHGVERDSWPYRIRPAAPGDLETLRDVERAAGHCFRAIGMAEIADDEPLPAAVLAAYQQDGRAWVAVTGDPAGGEGTRDPAGGEGTRDPAGGGGTGGTGDPVAGARDRDLDHVIGYLISDLVDGSVHIEQVSVHPGHARRGVGRSLIERTALQAAAFGMSALTLTTFRDVPWNAPYYARLGFRILDEGEWTPGLRAARRREAAHGLDRWPRVCMRRDLP